MANIPRPIDPNSVKIRDVAPEMQDLTFKLIFTPEDVSYIPVKGDLHPETKTIRVICPKCTAMGNGVTQTHYAVDENAIAATVDLPIVELRYYHFTERDVSMDVEKHGIVWAGKCRKCGHDCFTSKWKVESGIERMMGWK